MYRDGTGAGGLKPTTELDGLVLCREETKLAADGEVQVPPQRFDDIFGALRLAEERSASAESNFISTLSAAHGRRTPRG